MSKPYNRFNNVDSDVFGFDYNSFPKPETTPPPTYNPLPTSSPPKVQFGQPSVPSAVSSVAATTSSFSQFATWAVIIGVVYAVVSVSYNWYYYATTLIFFFSTTLPSITTTIALYASYFITIETQITNIQASVNITNGTATISSDRVLYNGYIPYYTSNVSNVTQALDSTALRLYTGVFSFSLTPSRFPALSFPTSQSVVNEDIGRRLLIVENATAVTTLPASSITYSSVYPFNETNVESALDRIETDLLSIESYDVIYVSAIGNDATCQFGILYPCLTLNGALVKANASLAARVSIKISAGVFLHPIPNTVPFRCGLDITGQDANTYLEMKNPTMDAGSMNTYSNCQLVLKSFQIAIAGNMDMTAVGTTVTDWRTYVENVTFVNSVAVVSFTGNAGFCWLNFLDVSSNGGISSITFTDMVGTFNGLSINSQININQITKNGFFQFDTFAIGAGGFHINNQMSSGTTYIFMHNGNNLGSLAWDFNTTTGGTTALRGDATMGMINSGGIYGPIQYGSGTLTIFRETGISGIEIPRKNLIYHISATYGNDATCDGSEYLPCLTLYRLAQLLPNTSSQYAQITIMFDNGLYVESNYIAIKPNWVLVGNEISTLLIFNAGAGLDGGSWIATGTGYVSFLRFGLIRCVVACNFDMSSAAPSTSVFSVFRFYNSSIDTSTAPMAFKRRSDISSYFRVIMESTVVTGTNMTFQDMTDVTWSISGDIYTALIFNYNTSSTYSSGSPFINMNGLVSHGSISVNNYVSGVIVDWSLMAVINRDSATLMRNYVSGAVINVHGDVLGLGVINGGLISTGAGSGTTEYLTKAPGLGYTPANTTYWGISGVPVQVGDALDKLAKRAYDLENIIHPSIYTGGFITSTAGITGSNSCGFIINLNVGPTYISGPNVIYQSTNGELIYNGSSVQGFLFEFAARVTYSYSVSSSTRALAGTTLTISPGSSYSIQSNLITPLSTGTTDEFRIEWSDVVFLTPGDVIAMFTNINTDASTTFTACSISSSSSTNYIRFTQIP